MSDLSAPPPGNEAVRSTLRRWAASGRLHHCLLFEGPAGIGKAAAAQELALFLNCTGGDGGGARPCGACWSCRAIAGRSHPDVVTLSLDPERTAPVISVAQVRALLGELTVQPHSARRRMIVVDPADALTVESANALLKTLEEPPKDTGFVLVSALPDTLLPTIRSRCQRVRFRPVAEAAVVAWLVGLGHAADVAAEAAALAGGSPGRARELADGEGARLAEERDALLRALEGDAEALFAYAEAVGRGERSAVQERAGRLLTALEGLLHDALQVRVRGAAARLGVAAGRPAVARAWAAQLDLPALGRLHAALGTVRRDLAAHINTRLVLEAYLAQLIVELGPARRAGASA